MQTMEKRLKALLIDHDDSFTLNVKWWLTPVYDVELVHHTSLSVVADKIFDLIVLSPGPKSPSDYPEVLNFLETLSPVQPVLGICLGFQMMTVASGGRVETYAPPLHGKTSTLESVDLKFNRTSVARYHSMACQVPENFQVLATSDQLPMWAVHQNKKWMGLQFHPESFMTEKADQWLNTVQEWAQ